MPHYAKCDVISRQNKKFKLKYLINKMLQRKSTKELVVKVIRDIDFFGAGLLFTFICISTSFWFNVCVFR